jgi:hypothetical protein
MAVSQQCAGLNRGVGLTLRRVVAAARRCACCAGLDAASAFFCVRALRRLADHGRAVVTAVHQPSPEAFDMLDLLLLMCKGQMVYFGAAAASAQFYAAAGHPRPLSRSLPDHLVFTMNTDFKDVAADFRAPGFCEMRDRSNDNAPSGGVGSGAASAVDGNACEPRGWVKVHDVDLGIACLTNRFEFSLRVCCRLP